jgi:hypothetical protein
MSTGALGLGARNRTSETGGVSTAAAQRMIRSRRNLDLVGSAVVG